MGVTGVLQSPSPHLVIGFYFVHSTLLDIVLTCLFKFFCSIPTPTSPDDLRHMFVSPETMSYADTVRYCLHVVGLALLVWPVLPQPGLKYSVRLHGES